MKWDKAKYPPAQGWIKMVAAMTSGTPLTKDGMKRTATLGKPQNYEFGPLEQRGKQLSVILRHKRA